MKTILSLTFVIGGLLLATGLPSVQAAEIVILDDGRTIQAEKTEIIGDRLRIEKPAGIIEVPRSSVRSIHEATPPGVSKAPSAPAAAYGDMTQQMNDKVRQEIQQSQTPSRH